MSVEYFKQVLSEVTKGRLTSALEKVYPGKGYPGIMPSGEEKVKTVPIGKAPVAPVGQVPTPIKQVPLRYGKNKFRETMSKIRKVPTEVTGPISKIEDEIKTKDAEGIIRTWKRKQ